jgi:nucleoid-associated protein YgaU
VAIPNTAKSTAGAGDEASPQGASIALSRDPARDPAAHADKAIQFEVESPRATSRRVSGRAPARAEEEPRPPRADGAVMAPVSAKRAKSELEPDSSQIETVPHVVERSENFWTISRLYYGTGRYYRALWKANAGKYPKIDELHIGDVILIPAVEDLDPTYIEAPRSRPAQADANSGNRSRASGIAQSPRSGAGRDSLSPTRTTRVSNIASARPISSRSASRSGAVLDLPPGDAGSRRDRDDRAGRSESDDPGGLDDGAQLRVAARPRSTSAPALPVYKVRPYDTLRSIARDTLGDPRRADEILELNRQLIDDPAHLITGQLIELPEDADTRRVSVIGP